MRTPKSYKVLATVGAGDSPQIEGPRVPTSAVLFELVVDPTRNRKFEFSAWLGKGIDQWVWSCVEVLRVLANSGTITARTIVNYAGSAVPKWFAFLTETQGPARPQDLAPEHVKKYVNWLRLRHPFTSTAQTLYSQTKPVLIAMSEHGLIPLGHDELFPINPFAGKSTRKQGPTSLT